MADLEGAGPEGDVEEGTAEAAAPLRVFAVTLTRDVLVIARDDGAAWVHGDAIATEAHDPNDFEAACVRDVRDVTDEVAAIDPRASMRVLRIVPEGQSGGRLTLLALLRGGVVGHGKPGA